MANLATLARIAGETLTEGPRVFGSSIAQALKSPIEKRRLNKDAETDQTIEEIMARRAQQTGDYSGLQRYLDYTAQRQRNVAQPLRQAQKDAITGGAKTALTIASAGPLDRAASGFALSGSSLPALARLGVGSSIGSVLGGGLAVIQGQDPIEGAVRGAAESAKTVGLNNITAPAFNPIIRIATNNPVSARAGQAVAGGLTNLAEDELFTRLSEMRTPTANERLFSGLMGALTAQMPLDKKNEIVEEDVQKATKYVRDAGGRFAEVKNKITNKLKGKYLSDLDVTKDVGDIKINDPGNNIKNMSINDYVEKYPKQANGLVSGIEFETDKEGKITGVTYNPTKALIGVAAISIPTMFRKTEDLSMVQSPFTRPQGGRYANTPVTQTTMDQQIRANQAQTGQQAITALDDAINTKDVVKTQQLIDYLRSLPDNNQLKQYIEPSISIANRVGMDIN